MKASHQKTSIMLFATPCELRQIANRMEELWNQKLSAGTDLCVDSTLGTIEIRFVIDQEAMERDRGRPEAPPAPR